MEEFCDKGEMMSETPKGYSHTVDVFKKAEYPPFPDNRTRSDYDFGGTEREMASLVVVAWGARLGIIYSIISNCALDPKNPECAAQLKTSMKDLDFALQAMEDWKKFRSEL